MSRNDHHDLKYPGTYIALLPHDLRLLLSAFYYGPLEIRMRYIESYINDEFIVNLSINTFDSNNRIVGTMIFPLMIETLLRLRQRGEENLADPPIYILLKPNAIYIQLEHEPNFKGFTNAHVNLFDFQTELFWSKLAMIHSRIHQYKAQGLNIKEINQRMSFSMY